MKGFADNCLVLFPKPESYEYRSDMYHLNLKRSLENLLKYLESCDIKPQCFTTDEVALLVNPRDVEWLQTLSDPDNFFMMTHNVAMEALKFKQVTKLTDLYSKINKSVQLERGLTEEQRFEVIVKREARITKELITEAKIVIIFEQPNNSSYKVVSKDGDGRICIYINNKTFIPKCFISGIQADPNDLLGFSGANRPVYQWEVK